MSTPLPVPQADRRTFLKQSLGALAGMSLASLPGKLSAADDAPPPTRPNVLWITTEDHGPRLGCYGDPLAHTPHLDALASQGLRYTNAFTVAGVCAPSRSALITGHYPTTLGTQHMRCEQVLPANIQPFPGLLRAAGYWCTNAFKEDYNFAVPRDTWDATGSYSRERAHWRHRPDPEQPFFAVFNLPTTHEWHHRSVEGYEREVARVAPEHRVEPHRVQVPGYYPDTAEVRRDLAHQYNLIAAVDQEVGAIVAALDEDDLADRTFVFFFSDHGDGLPRAKRWVYDSGLHVPLLVRIPKAWQDNLHAHPGGVRDELVSFVDFAPTLLRLAGLEPPADLPGRAFLRTEPEPERRYVFGFRDRIDESIDTVRAVRDQRYKYIRNYQTWQPPLIRVDYAEKVPSMKALRAVQIEQGGAPAVRQLFHRGKPPEELYDTRNDPDEVVNLAYDPRLQGKLHEMRQACVQWMLACQDTGFLPEAELEQQANTLGSAYNVMRHPPWADRLPLLLAVASLAAAGDFANADELQLFARSPHVGVRYWAVRGLGALGAPDTASRESLARALHDASNSVRAEAARFCLNLPDLVDEALRVLLTLLREGDLYERLAAAHGLEAAGTRVRPFASEIAAALQREPQNSYTARVLQRVASVITVSSP